MSSKKRSAPLDNPPSASSSDEEDDSSSEGESEDDQQQPQQQQLNFSQPSSESDDEEEQENPNSQNPNFQNPNFQNPNFQNPNFQNPNGSSDDDEDDEEEEEEDESAESDEETQTPTFTKPKTLTLTPPSSSLDNSDIVSPSASDFAIKPSKKIETFTPRKKIKTTLLEDDKKMVNKRVWTDDDEIMLLEGYLEYFSDKGCSPLSDLDDFYKFMMDSLPGNATKSQLYEKIRRLKKKFRVNVEKGGPGFAKVHDSKVFDVSKRIWGDEGCEDGKRAKPKARVKPVKEMDVEEDEVEVVVEEKDFETLYPYWNAGLVSEVSSSLKFPAGVVELVKENLSLIGEGKAKQMDEKWKVLFENETLLRRKRIALLSEVENVEG